MYIKPISKIVIHLISQNHVVLQDFAMSQVCYYTHIFSADKARNVKGKYV